MQVEVKDGRLLAVKIVENYDTPDIAGPALKGIPERMVKAVGGSRCYFRCYFYQPGYY